MFKFEKDVVHTSNVLEVVKTLPAQFATAIRNKWQALEGTTQKSLDRLDEKRAELRDDFYL